MIKFVAGTIIGTMLIEPIVINLIYMSNPALFDDIILTEKNSKKLKKYYKGIEK